jgi:hypothetical protein
MPVRRDDVHHRAQVRLVKPVADGAVKPAYTIAYAEHTRV